MHDHIHTFIGLKPACAISDLVRDIKNNSSKFINERKYVRGKFSWQEGYGVFSYSHSHISRVYNYILNQEKHHQKRLLNKNTLSYLKNLKSTMMKNIYLNGLRNNFTPAGFVFLFGLRTIIISPLRGCTSLS